MTSTSESVAIGAVREWLRRVVIGHNLCPFAARELQLDRIRFAETHATAIRGLLDDLAGELEHLAVSPDVETTVLILTDTLARFDDYNAFLDAAEELIAVMGLEGVIQVASFHPDYCFADSDPDDPANYTNRSPYPLLHLLREQSLARAIERHDDTSRIPERNVAHFRDLGLEEVQQMLRQCLRHGEQDIDSK